MFSVLVADQVRFKTRKGNIFTSLPVFIEFGKVTKGDRGSKYVNSTDWKKLSSDDAEGRDVASPTDLLHAVIALYNTCLPDVTVQSLYRTVCAEGTKTLLLLRDTSEILQEWESHYLPSSASQSREDSFGEINNNPQFKEKSSTCNTSDSSPCDRDHVNVVSSPGHSPRSPPEKELHSRSHPEQQKNRSVVVPSITTPTNNHGTKDSPAQDEWKPWTPKMNCNYERFRPIDNSPDKVVSPMIQPAGRLGTRSVASSINSGHNTPFHSESGNHGEPELPVESPFSDVFSDSGDDSEIGSDMEEDDDHEDFSRGLDAFLKAVVARKKERRTALERYSLQSTHVGIEHRLIAAATFNKNYRIPGTRVVYLSLVSVRRRFRRCGIGKFLLKKLKSPSQVGPYDALVVRADAASLNFFLKSSFTNDIILNSRFRELEIDGCPKGTLVCYLPPFDGHYPPLPGTQDWNSSEAVEAMEEEVDKWRNKSLEAYQTQVTCLTRLQQEVLRLHNLLKRQDSTIQFLKRENSRLQGRLSRVERKSAQALIDALEKEATDFERFCVIQNQNNETS